MPVGNVSLTVRDGGLGIVGTLNANSMVVLGTSQLGVANTLYSLSSNDDINAQLGAGPLSEEMSYCLSVAGGSILGMPLAGSVAGASGAVTMTRVGASTSVMTTTGIPFDAYSVVVTVVSAGTGQTIAAGAIQITVSFDGGLTQSASVTIPAGGSVSAFAATTGVTLVFTVANLDFGDKATFTSSAPFYGSSDLNTAFTALVGLSNTWSMVKLVGYPTAGSSAANATASATIASTLDTNMQTAAANFRYARAIMQAPPSLDADLQTSFVNFSSTRTMVCGGTAPITSPITGRKITRGFSLGTAGRLLASRPSVSPGRFSDGGIVGVQSLLRDERKTPGLFDSRFAVSLTYLGVPGFFADIGRVMAPLGSDFTYIMNGRVLDLACTISRISLLQFLNSSVRVNAQTGVILEQDARSIENYVEQQIRAQMSQEISPDSGTSKSVQITVNRTNNILSTSQLLVKTRIIPLGYAGSISEDIGFLNPTLTLV